MLTPAHPEPQMSQNPAQPSPDVQAEDSAEFDSKSKQPQGQVRFASVAEEIDPPESAPPPPPPVTFNKPDYDRKPEEKEKLLSLAQSLHESKQLQGSRLRKFSFDPISLPASRVRMPLTSQSDSVVNCGNAGRDCRS